MINIKNGKLYGSNYSFAMPENFNREVGLDCFSDDDLVLRSLDHDYLSIVVYFKKEHLTAEEGMQKMFDKNNCLVKTSDLISVKRGKGTGVGLFFVNTFGGCQHYGERYAFKKNRAGETQIFIDVCFWPDKGKKKQTIQDAVEFPTVKAFLESIEYF